MQIQCPHCQNPIELLETPPPREVVCAVCGSSINLDPGRTFTMAPGSARRRIGRFELIETVGIGAHGTVYKARDTQLDRIVAVKVPRVTALPSQADVDRFLRESRSTAQLKHPSIVSLYDAGQIDGTCYLVSEFVQGATLGDRLTSGRLTFRQAAELIVKVSDALHYAHQQGIVHRDIKPSNIMLDLTGEPHLMDFGLAKREAGEITMTVDGQVLGTPAYMSPEQARGEAHLVDPRSDIYSLGVVLYELLTGELPFRGNVRMLLVQVLQDEPRLPRRLNDRIPKDLETVCMKAMAKEPGRRYQRAGELAEDLRRWLRGEPVLARPVSSFTKVSRWCRRNPAVAGLSAAVVLLLLSVAGGASFSALHLRKLATRERQLHADTDLARQAAVSAKGRADESRREAVKARDEEARERRRAEALAKHNRVSLYAARMNLAQQAWESADIALALELLQSQLPKAGDEDLRGFEWYYLWQLCHNERLTIQVDNAPVRSVALSPDGKWLAAAAGNIVRWCELASGRPQATFHLAASVRAVAISPNGRFLAAGGGEVGHSGRVKIWNLAEKQEVATWTDFSDPVLAIAFTPDGKSLATGTTRLEQGWGNPLTRLIWAGSERKKGQVKLWNVDTREPVVNCDGETGGILSLAFSPDGKSLAAGCWDASVLRWDPETGKLQTVHQGLTSYAWSIAFAPNGSLLAGGGKWDGRPQLKRWSTSDSEVAMPSSHTAGITSLAFSHNGKYLATASWDRTIKLRDVTTGEEIQTFKGHTSYVSSVAFSRDDENLISSSWDGEVKVWYTRTALDHSTLMGWDVGGYCVSFDPQGKLLASATNDAVSIRDLSSGEIRASLPGHSQTLVAFAPQDQTMATTGMDRIVTVYSTSNWKELHTLKGHTGAIWALAYSPDAKVLATGSRDATAKLWDVSTGKELATLDGGLGGTVRSVAFSPNGSQLAAAVHVRAGGKSMVKIWDVATRKEIAAFNAHRHNIESIAFSPDGKTLATASHDTTAMLWDTETWEARATLRGHVESIYHLAFSPDGRTLATAGWDGVIGLWNTASGQLLAKLKGHSGNVWSVAFSPDGRMLSSGSTYGVATSRGTEFAQQVKLWHAANDDDVQWQTRILSAQYGSSQVSLRGNGKAMQAVAYVPKGTVLAAADLDGSVLFWDLSRDAEPARTQIHDDRISCLDVSPDGRMVATASLDGTAKLMEISSKQARTTLQAHGKRIDAVAFSPDGQTVVTGGVEDPTAIVWNVSNGQKLAELNISDTVSCLAFSADGKRLAVGSWGPSRVQLWDVSQRKRLHTLTGHRWGITCVAFSPNGAQVAAGGGFGDPTIRLWDAATGKEQATLTGHSDETTGLAFSPDGKRLLSVSWDRTLKVWDLTTLQEYGTIFGHTHSILDLAFSSQGDSFATASSEGAIRVWNWPNALEQSIALPRPALPRVPPPQREYADLQQLYQQQRWQELAIAAEEAVQVLPSKKSIYQYLGEAHFQLKNYAAAIPAFERHLDLCPNCRSVMDRLASCFSAQNNHAQALKVHERMLELDPTRADAHNNLAWMYVAGPEEVRNVRRGLELAHKAIELDPTSESSWNTLGVALYRAGEFQKATEALLHSMNSSPNNRTAFDLFFLAMSQHKLGNAEQAKQSYYEALEWYQKQLNLPADSKHELETFRTEAASILGITSTDRKE